MKQQQRTRISFFSPTRTLLLTAQLKEANWFEESRESTAVSDCNTGIFRLTCKRSEIHWMLRLIMILIKIKRCKERRRHIGEIWIYESMVCTIFTCVALSIRHANLFCAYAKIIKDRTDSELKEFNECNPIRLLHHHHLRMSVCVCVPSIVCRHSHRAVLFNTQFMLLFILDFVIFLLAVRERSFIFFLCCLSCQMLPNAIWIISFCKITFAKYLPLNWMSFCRQHNESSPGLNHLSESYPIQLESVHFVATIFASFRIMYFGWWLCGWVCMGAFFFCHLISSAYISSSFVCSSQNSRVYVKCTPFIDVSLSM